jgi:hypothetical protein
MLVHACLAGNLEIAKYIYKEHLKDFDVSASGHYLFKSTVGIYHHLNTSQGTVYPDRHDVVRWLASLHVDYYVEETEVNGEKTMTAGIVNNAYKALMLCEESYDDACKLLGINQIEDHIPEEDICRVCLDDYLPRWVILPCGHNFCLECLLAVWYKDEKLNKTCLYCIKNFEHWSDVISVTKPES